MKKNLRYLHSIFTGSYNSGVDVVNKISWEKCNFLNFYSKVVVIVRCGTQLRFGMKNSVWTTVQEGTLTSEITIEYN